MIYESLNIQAKDYLIKELDEIFYKKYKDEDLLKRCYKEINILYDKQLLFIIEHLYKYKKQNEGTSYHFEGTINNLLFLYVLELSKVDPIKYKLPYELFIDKKINVKLINDVADGLVDYLDKCDNDLKIVLGVHKKEDIKEIDELVDAHYLLIPSFAPPEDMLLKINTKHFIYETVEDYREYTDIYLTIRISEKYYIIDYENIGLENVIANEFEKEIADILNPKTIDDYVKIKSIARSTHVWKNNQDKLVKEGIININNLVANIEDIFDYLIDHSIDKEVALEIINFVKNGNRNSSPYLWNKYIKIMKEHNCEDIFIDIISKILYIRGRGEAVSECLFVMDENNYLEFEYEGDDL